MKNNQIGVTIRAGDSMKERAHILAKAGYYVFPIVPLSKVPALSNWENEATLDKEKIDELWDTPNENCNIGIACGPSKLLVLDIDEKDDKHGKESFQKLIKNKVFPQTKVVATPSGGRHYYLRIPPGLDHKVRSTVCSLGEGIDTRAEGGYVLSEESMLPSGNYKAMREGDIRFAPGWLTEQLKAPNREKEPYVYSKLDLDQEADIKRAEEFLHNAERAIQGRGGDHLTYETCCVLHDMGISIEKGVELLEVWNQRCNPAWSKHALYTKMRNAYDFAQSMPGCKSVHMGAIVSPPKYIHAVSAMNLNIPPRDWLIEGRLISGFITVTLAPGGVGKSMFTMLEAISVATGLPLTGVKPKRRGAVLIYNTEDPQSEIERRILAICLLHGIDPKSLDNVFYASGVESPLRFVVNEDKRAIVTEDRKKLEQIVKDNEIILVVIDPFVRAHGVDENNNADIDRVCNELSGLAMGSGCSISIVHHTRKVRMGESGTDQEIGRGASSLTSAARVVSTILGPSEEEARSLGIPIQTKYNYLRVNHAKGNMTPPSLIPVWFKKHSVKINAEDNVGALRITGKGDTNESSSDTGGQRPWAEHGGLGPITYRTTNTSNPRKVETTLKEGFSGAEYVYNPRTGEHERIKPNSGVYMGGAYCASTVPPTDPTRR